MIFGVPYLREFYDEERLDEENRALMEFYAREYEAIPEGALVLDFGSGPTLYAVVSAAATAREIHVCDKLDENLELVRAWIEKPDARWEPYILFALTAEGSIAREGVADRVGQLRSKIRRVEICDALLTDPLGAAARGRYDVVSSNFCAECVSSDPIVWGSAMQNIFSLLRPGGWGILCSIESAEYYLVGDKRYDAVPVTQADVRRAMIAVGFDPNSLSISRVDADCDRGYSGIIFASAMKR